MRRWMILIVALTVALTIIPTMATASTDSSSWLDSSKVNQGAIGIQYAGPENKRTKLVVAFDNKKYTYDLTRTSDVQFFPLQSGSGTYKITIFEQVTGNQYKKLHTSTLNSTLEDVNDIYLNSIQNVNWQAATKATAKAKVLTKGKKTDMDKLEVIHEYMINEIAYDYDLAKKSKSVYIPDIDETLSSGQAICYGYASLFAAMLRSLDIPTKLVMGNTTYVDGYHAWNEVFVDGNWIIIDTTVDYAYKNNKKAISLAKEEKDYSANQVY